MTTPPFNHRWEERLHQELRKLPDMQAPESLVPSVMAAIRARQEAAIAWYRRPATTWPMPLRVALGVSSLALFALLVLGGQLTLSQVGGASEASFISELGTRISSLWTTALVLVNAVGLVLRDTVTPTLIIIVGAACFSYIALLGAGGALWRAAMHHRVDV